MKEPQECKIEMWDRMDGTIRRKKTFGQSNDNFHCFSTVQCLIIYYIPTNCTNLLFIYKQHIKTFVLFKLLKLLLHVSVTD